VQVGPSNGKSIMVTEGIKAGEEVALLPPQDSRSVQRMSSDTYANLSSESRRQAMQIFVERLDRGMYRSISDSFVVASASGKNLQTSTTLADCTAAIDRMLSEDSSKGITSGRVRIGPGEGGKLAPLSPETLQQMKPGEKISVSVPAASDSSADSLKAGNEQQAPDSVRSSQEPPDEI
jgi:hypothetical protein